MATLNVVDWDKKKVGEVTVSESLVTSPVRMDLLHEVVKWQLAKKRSGTHNTKTRAFVRGGGKKPFKQKGTGQARQGTSRSPLMPGGAILFGPQPRDYSYTLPKNVRKAGLRSALSLLNRENSLHVLKSVEIEDGKSKNAAGKFKKMGLKRAVVVDTKMDPMTSRAIQNIRGFVYYNVQALNVFDLLKMKNLLITADAIKAIDDRLTGEG